MKQSSSTSSSDENVKKRKAYNRFDLNRMIFKYPDGSYSYAFKSDLHEGWMEVRPKLERDKNYDLE